MNHINGVSPESNSIEHTEHHDQHSSSPLDNHSAAIGTPASHHETDARTSTNPSGLYAHQVALTQNERVSDPLDPKILLDTNLASSRKAADRIKYLSRLSKPKLLVLRIEIERLAENETPSSLAKHHFKTLQREIDLAFRIKIERNLSFFKRATQALNIRCNNHTVAFEDFQKAYLARQHLQALFIQMPVTMRARLSDIIDSYQSINRSLNHIWNRAISANTIQSNNHSVAAA